MIDFTVSISATMGKICAEIQFLSYSLEDKRRMLTKLLAINKVPQELKTAIMTENKERQKKSALTRVIAGKIIKKYRYIRRKPVKWQA